MRPVRELIERLGDSDASVLVTGESGTGKEVRGPALIHAWTPRAPRAVRRRSTARALPEALLESELFGHEKGAFTGAIARTTGLFERGRRRHAVPRRDRRHAAAAAGEAAARRSQEREFDARRRRRNDDPVDVRVIAATNRDLEAGGRRPAASARTSTTA